MNKLIFRIVRSFGRFYVEAAEETSDKFSTKGWQKVSRTYATREEAKKWWLNLQADMSNSHEVVEYLS